MSAQGTPNLTIKTTHKIDAVVLPERVAFVNLKTGNVFFDCHPSEARAAMKAVEEMRQKKSQDADAQKRKELNAFIDAVLKTRDVTEPVHFDLLGDTGDLSLTFMSNRFRDIELNNVTVTTIIVNAREYAWFRTVGQIAFDQATQKEVLEQGLFGHFWTADVFVRSACPPGEIIFAGQKDDGSIVAIRSIVRAIPIPKDSSVVLDILRDLSAKTESLTGAVKHMLIPHERRPNWSLGKTAVVTEIQDGFVHFIVHGDKEPCQRKELLADFNPPPRVGDAFLIRETFDNVQDIQKKS